MAAIPYTTGLQLLLDARTITGLSDGDKVASWADQSGYGNDASQATEAHKPTYKTNIYGSNPAVRQVDQTDSMGGSYSSWGTPAEYTVLQCVSNVVYPQTTNGGRMVCSESATGTDVAGYMNLLSINQGTYNARQNNTILVDANFSPNFHLSNGGTGQPVVCGFASSATKFDVILNGVLRHDVTTAAGVPSSISKYGTGYMLNGSPGNANCAILDYHFIAVYNKRLSPANIESVVGWMLSEMGARQAAGGGGGGGGMVRHPGMAGGLVG